MEDEQENLEELEQQLYAQVYHDSNIEESFEIPSSTPNTSANSMRYWQNQNTNTKVPFKQRQKSKKFTNSAPLNSNEDKVSNNESENAEKPAIVKPYFVPYTSVLSFMNNPQPITEDVNFKDDLLQEEPPKNYEKKKTKVTKFPKEKQCKFLKPLKKFTKQKYEEKKQKAEKVRNKKTSSVVIDLATSSDDDSIIHIENPPPPLISLDSSDEETRRKKKRAASPSTSSMVSDDFIVASDKRRIINPFSNSEQIMAISDKLKTSMNENEKKMRKMKALTKVSSSSSSNSNSARSSCERNDEKISSKSKKNKRDKVCNSNDAGDSIYSSKAMTFKEKDTKCPSTSSSSDAEDNSICVTAKDAKVRRRKSTGSRKEKDSENDDDDPKLQKASGTSTPLAHKKKRSRFITPNYNEDEFASLISTVMQDDDDDEEVIETINKSKALINAIESDEKMPIVEAQSEDIQPDCEIIEQDIPILDVSDEDIPNVPNEAANSDSEDSIKHVSGEIEYDLTLNIRKSNHSPHEFIPVDNARVLEQKMQSNKLDCEVGWNDEMKYYYNECTMGREFCIATIKNSMPTDAKLWRINHADKIRINDNDRKIRCRNCNEWGHKERYCSRPRKKIICYMCGEIGHRETRCPNSICLRCGKPNVVYATMCGNCSKFTKKVCPLCHYKGHDIDQCPDKWRRYHSTTTITETTALDISYTQNPRVYCSLCARSGHFAENCNNINKLFHGLIKSSWFVISNKPSYSVNYHFDATRENEHVLQLLTYMENYSFNLKLPSNCQFYPKFREAFLRHRENQMMLLSSSSKQNKKRKRDKSRKDEKELEKCKVNQSDIALNAHHDDSNSNYSFSEFYKSNAGPSNENELTADRNAQSLGDYIPLVSSNNDNQIIPVVDETQKICDSKVFLTKEHAMHLMSEKGQNLLFDLCEKFGVVSQFKTDSFGNSILLTGLPLNQQLFHVEMKDFLYKCGLDEYERMVEKTTQIPKIICRIVSYLKANFYSIKTTGIRETKQLLDKFTAAEKSLDHKKVVKCRKALNIIFIGHAELGDGARHMNELKKILVELEREVLLGNGDAPIDPKLRNEISVHIRYVFSAIDHSSLYGDYRKMFEEYKKVVMRRQGNRRNSTSSHNR